MLTEHRHIANTAEWLKFGVAIAIRSRPLMTCFPGSGLFKIIALCCTISPSAPLLAQDTETADEPQNSSKGGGERSIAVPAEVIRQPPMTVELKFTYHLKQTVDPLAGLRSAAGAALDQWRDHPGGWGQGWDMYGVRVASHFGQHLIKQQILFGVQALDHENPEHLRSNRSGFTNRVIDAVRYTFTSNSDSGKVMPAYSRFVAAYGSAYISRTWYPPNYHTVLGGLSAGTTSLGVDVAMNILREFGPDIKEKLRRHYFEGT